MISVGTNQQNRSAVSFLDLYGPQGGQTDGYQYTFVGNSVFCPVTPMPFRWGILLSDSHYGLIQDNVVYNWAGAGIMLENGNETGNMIAGNDIVDITGSGDGRADDRGWSDLGMEGTGIWMHGVNSYIVNNVVSDAVFGYTIYTMGQALEGGVDTQIPLAPGDDPWLSGQYKVVDMTDTPILDFSGNAVYGATDTGLTIWSVGTQVDTPHADARPSVVNNMVMWNIFDRGYYGYETNNLTINNLTFVGDTSMLANYAEGPLAIYSSDYYQQNFTITNSTIEGAKVGWIPSVRTAGTQTIENTYMDNYFNIIVESIWFNPGAWQGPRTTLINNVQFSKLFATDLSGLGAQSNIDMLPINGDQLTTNLFQTDVVLVTNYNDVAGDDFQVYYTQQAAITWYP